MFLLAEKISTHHGIHVSHMCHNVDIKNNTSVNSRNNFKILMVLLQSIFFLLLFLSIKKTLIMYSYGNLFIDVLLNNLT